MATPIRWIAFRRALSDQIGLNRHGFDSPLFETKSLPILQFIAQIDLFDGDDVHPDPPPRMWPGPRTGLTI